LQQHSLLLPGPHAADNAERHFEKAAHEIGEKAQKAHEYISSGQLGERGRSPQLQRRDGFLRPERPFATINDGVKTALTYQSDIPRILVQPRGNAEEAAG
jgi:hypothetical protein